MKGSVNPLTEIVEGAIEEILELDQQIAATYGIPLFVKDAGRSESALLEWPKDPDEMSPEEMSLLVATRGEDAVMTWLTEHYMTRLEREAFDPEFKE